MRLLELGIQNYKSLRNITLKPGDLSVFIGPNGAGKSNLCDALDFVGEMYRWGLELAVMRHGGYENICYRHARRSKSPITFRVVTSLSPDQAFFRRTRREDRTTPREVIIEHQISFRAADQRIRAPFRIVDESIRYLARYARELSLSAIFSALRHNDELVELSSEEVWRQNTLPFLRSDNFDVREIFDGRLSPTESFLRILERYLIPVTRLGTSLGSIDLYQLNPTSCRVSGVPTPNPKLGRDGENLPGVIDLLKNRRPREFQSLLDTLKTIMPTLEDVHVVNTPQKTLGLSFLETGFGRPWTSDDVSDGTIRALGLLASLFNPDSEVVIIEEPENSLHPWAIGQFIDACRVASESKQILLTTHSPVLINHLRPEEVWVVERHQAETKVDQLVVLDPDARVGWEEGRFTLSEYLDSGIVPGAVPAAPA